jgi:hypothetical protein
MNNKYNQTLMSSDLIPGDVKQFILDNIDSVAQLEGLLLLRGSPETPWNLTAIAQRLYIDEQQTAGLLGSLCIRGFLTIKEAAFPVYCYQPSSSDLKDMVDRLAEAYKQYLVPVTNLIHSKPQTRVQEFADAFKLRGRRKK